MQSGEHSESNPKIVESISDVNLSVMGQSRAESMSVGFESLAHSISLIMHNAGSAQFGAQQLGLAAVSKTCKEILSQI